MTGKRVVRKRPSEIGRPNVIQLGLDLHKDTSGDHEAVECFDGSRVGLGDVDDALVGAVGFAVPALASCVDGLVWDRARQPQRLRGCGLRSGRC